MPATLPARPFRVYAVGALTILMTVLAQPALAARPHETIEPITNAGDWIDQNLARLVGSSARLLKERTRAATLLIETGDIAGASKEVSAAQDSAGAIRSLMPFVVAVDQLEEARVRLLAGDFSRFRRDLMRIYARLDEMSDFDPDAAMRAKRQLMQAESDVDSGKIVEAGTILEDIRVGITGSPAYIPAVYVYDQLAAANFALSRAEPDIASAANAVNKADEILSVTVSASHDGQPS